MDYELDEMDELVNKALPEPEEFEKFWEWCCDDFETTQKAYMEVPANPLSDY